MFNNLFHVIETRSKRTRHLKEKFHKDVSTEKKVLNEFILLKDFFRNNSVQNFAKKSQQWQLYQMNSTQ